MPLPSAVEKKVSKSISSCRLSEDAENAAYGNLESRRCESKQDVPAHAALLQGMWVHAARAHERDLEHWLVQLQVPRFCCRPVVRAFGLLSPPEGAARYQTRRRRIFSDPERPTRARGQTAQKVRPSLQCSRVIDCLVPVLRLSLCVSTDRDRARAFPAQAMGLFRPTPHPLVPLRRLRLKIRVLELRRADDDEWRAWTPTCRYREPPAHMIATRSPPLLTCSDLLCSLRPHHICLI